MTDRAAGRMRLAFWLICTYPLVHFGGGLLDLSARISAPDAPPPLVGHGRNWAIAVVLLLIILGQRAVFLRPPVPLWAMAALGVTFVWAGWITAMAEPAAVSGYGLRRLVDLIVTAALALAVMGVFAARTEPGKLLAWLIVLAGLLTLPLMALTEVLMGLKAYNPHAVLPGVMSLRPLGLMLTVGTLAAAGLALISPGRGRWAALAAMAILWAGVLWSGSRGGTLSVLTALAIGVVVFAHLRSIAPLLLGALVIGAALSLLPGAPLPAYDVVGKLIAPGPPEAGGLSSYRTVIWDQSLDLIAQRPWSGYGFLQGFEIIDWPTQPQFHVHNLPLELALGLGLPVAAIALLLIGYALLAALRQARVDPASVPGFLVLLGLVGLSLVSGSFLHFGGLVPTAFVAATLFLRARHIACGEASR